MNAVAHIARDVSPVLELLVTIETSRASIDATVKYQVSYPSIRHRANAMAPDVEILSANYLDGTEIKSLPLPRRLYDAIITRIEAAELETN